MRKEQVIAQRYLGESLSPRHGYNAPAMGTTRPSGAEETWPADGRDAVLLATIAAGTDAAAGEAFFARLVRNVAGAMGMKGAWVTEWLPESDRLRALSFWLADGYFGDYVYDVAGTPCEPVVRERRLCHIPERVVELFPEDPSLADLGAVSYLGVPLEDTDGRLLGHLALLDDRPLPKSPRLESILRIFAGRAALELQRLRRDRDLIEQRRKLARLFEHTLDAIIELDEAGRISQMNGPAGRLLGGERVGTAFAERTSAACRVAFLDGLEALRAGRGPIWLPPGFEALDADGRRFPAEGTLAPFEDGGRQYFSLILRNVRDREEAARRIEALEGERESLREELDRLQDDSEIVGSCEAIRRLLLDVHRVAMSDATVLVSGETGTGKELVARAIHRASRRAKARLVSVNCAAIPPSLQESEFFGHAKGAFTGATDRRDGRFKLADGGTLFLDEVGELPLDLQAKLLRVLQEGEFEPVGSGRTERVDVRVVAATHRDLRRMVEEGAFREDLYYRLDVFPLRLPPLRERGGDVVAIAEALVDRLVQKRGYEPARLTEDGRARLLAYDWPGNIRELQNVIERALVTARGGLLDLSRALPDLGPPDEVAPKVGPEASDGSSPDGTSRVLTAAEWADAERANLLRALTASCWKISGAGGAAERLGLRPSTLSSRMKALGIVRPRLSP